LSLLRSQGDCGIGAFIEVLYALFKKSLWSSLNELNIGGSIAHNGGHAFSVAFKIELHNGLVLLLADSFIIFDHFRGEDANGSFSWLSKSLILSIFLFHDSGIIVNGATVSKQRK